MEADAVDADAVDADAVEADDADADDVEADDVEADTVEEDAVEVETTACIRCSGRSEALASIAVVVAIDSVLVGDSGLDVVADVCNCVAAAVSAAADLVAVDVAERIGVPVSWAFGCDATSSTIVDGVDARGLGGCVTCSCFKLE